MRRSVSWCAQSRDSKATFNNNLMQTWHYTFGPHAPQTQVLCGFLNRPTAATVEDGLNASLSRPQKIGRASTDAVLVAVGTHLPFMSLDQPYHAAALYPIKCMGDVV